MNAALTDPKGIAVVCIALLALGFGVMLVACRNGDSSAYTTGLEQYDLTAADISSLQPKAEAGDRKAAQKLMLYYGYVKRDNGEFERWRKLAEP